MRAHSNTQHSLEPRPCTARYYPTICRSRWSPALPPRSRSGVAWFCAAPARLLEASDLHERNAQWSPRSTAFRPRASGGAPGAGRCIRARLLLNSTEGRARLHGDHAGDDGDIDRGFMCVVPCDASAGSTAFQSTSGMTCTRVGSNESPNAAEPPHPSASQLYCVL